MPELAAVVAVDAGTVDPRDDVGVGEHVTLGIDDDAGAEALATAAIGSFFAGTIATLVIALFAPPLAAVALSFGPAEYFALMVLGLVAAVTGLLGGDVQFVIAPATAALGQIRGGQVIPIAVSSDARLATSSNAAMSPL